MSGPGLRETKRAETARALATTAHALVRERGLTEVTVDDIVEVAHVSRRTFSNYFSCKEEAVAAVVTQHAEAGLASWHPDPSSRDLLALVRDLVRHQAASGTLGALVDVAGLTAEHRQLVPFVREAQWRLWAMAGERVLAVLAEPGSSATPTGGGRSVHQPAERRAEVDAVLGAVFGVVSSLLGSSAPATDPTASSDSTEPTGSTAPTDPTDLPRLLDHVLTRLETGFGPPTPPMPPTPSTRRRTPGRPR
jgi:AcrR family transcriptional regulator